MSKAGMNLCEMVHAPMSLRDAAVFYGIFAVLLATIAWFWGSRSANVSFVAMVTFGIVTLGLVLLSFRRYEWGIVWDYPGCRFLSRTATGTLLAVCDLAALGFALVLRHLRVRTRSARGTNCPTRSGPSDRC